MNAPNSPRPSIASASSETPIPSLTEPKSQPRHKVSSQSTDFFFSEGSLHLQVEDIHYRVHSYLFERHSGAFLNQVVKNAAGGKVIYLDGVTRQDFEQLLSVLYPTNYQSYAPKSVAQWSGVLALATKWDFSSIRQLAIEHLDTIADSADKVSLGRAHGVEKWLLPAYLELSQRDEPLTMEEGNKLDKADIVRLMRVRYQIAKAARPAIELVAEAFDLKHDKPKVTPATPEYKKRTWADLGKPHDSVAPPSTGLSVKTGMPIVRDEIVAPQAAPAVVDYGVTLACEANEEPIPIPRTIETSLGAGVSLKRKKGKTRSEIKLPEQSSTPDVIFE